MGLKLHVLHIFAGGQIMTKSGQLMTTGGQLMTTGGQIMTTGGKIMTTGGQVLSTAGMKVLQTSVAGNKNSAAKLKPGELIFS